MNIAITVAILGALIFLGSFAYAAYNMSGAMDAVSSFDFDGHSNIMKRNALVMIPAALGLLLSLGGIIGMIAIYLQSGAA